jgi:hypothetical protein
MTFNKNIEISPIGKTSRIAKEKSFQKLRKSLTLLRAVEIK